MLRVAILVLLLSVSAASAQDSRTLFDEAAVGAARRDIDSMKLEELRVLADVLVDCGASGPTQLRSFGNACERHLERYGIEYASGRPLDSLLTSVSEYYRSYQSNRTTHDQDMKTFGRIRDVYVALKGFLNDAFRRLNKK